MIAHTIARAIELTLRDLSPAHQDRALVALLVAWRSLVDMRRLNDTYTEIRILTAENEWRTTNDPPADGRVTGDVGL